MKVTLDLNNHILTKLKKAIDKRYVKQESVNQLIEHILNNWIDRQEDL